MNSPKEMDADVMLRGGLAETSDQCNACQVDLVNPHITLRIRRLHLDLGPSCSVKISHKLLSQVDLQRPR